MAINTFCTVANPLLGQLEWRMTWHPFGGVNPYSYWLDVVLTHVGAWEEVAPSPSDTLSHQNRSLQEALFKNSEFPCKLDWEKRFNIILDVAQALAFLHLECNPSIIHGDVKPNNVLLDNNFNARIIDFSLASIKCDDFYYPDMFN
eukprot:Gb_20946 [translate_table: standard]